MKIRNGFVSNSSSSSFIVTFPREPKSAGDVHEMMFPKGEENIDYYDNEMSSTQAAHRVWEDVQDQQPDDSKAAYESIRNGWFDGAVDYPYGCEYKDEAWEAYDKENDERVKRIVKKHMEKNKGVVYTFSYSDNDGESALEHGEIFHHLPHIQTSYH